MWFPRPGTPGELTLLQPPGVLSHQDLFDLLHRSDVEEWRSKVGVAGPVEGSAKPSARLIATETWVLKTDLALGAPSEAEARSRIEPTLALADQARLWHPSKQWFLIRHGEVVYPASVCRRLRTLRALPTLEERMTAWTRMIAFTLAVQQGHAVGLDLNPANFGLDELQSLHYLDDELYVPLGLCDVAEAIVSRIPEEPDANPEDWHRWGTELFTALQPHSDERSWLELLRCAAGYPLTSAFNAARRRLLAGLFDRHPRLSSASAAAAEARPSLTCIFADVHGNLPALRAVLREARSMGADSYLMLGDVVGYGPHPRECIAEIADLRHATVIRGNHDQAVATGEPMPGMNSLARRVAEWTSAELTASERSWLGTLPLEHSEDRWLAVHGAPQDPHRLLAYVYEMTYRENLEHLHAGGCLLCFYGHTHVPYVHARTEDGSAHKLGVVSVTAPDPRRIALLNPGSVGQPRDGDPRAGFAMWERMTRRVTFHRVGYPIGQTTQDLQRAGLPRDLAYRLEMGR